MGGGVRNFNHFSETKQGTPTRGRLSNRFWECPSHDCSGKVWIWRRGLNTKARLSELEPRHSAVQTKVKTTFYKSVSPDLMLVCRK